MFSFKFKLFSFLLLLNVSDLSSYANSDISLYKVNLAKINNFRTVKAGQKLNLVLQNDISTKNSSLGDTTKLILNNGDGRTFQVDGSITKVAPGGILSMNGNINISASKIYLDNGEEANLEARSFSLTAHHPPHAQNSYSGLARNASRFALGASPATLGGSLAVGFLLNGYQSAKANGPQDFAWGGFSGSGLGILETLFRKQPDINLHSNAEIPFVLTNDLKINQGIKKEKIKSINIDAFSAKEKIAVLEKRGDLTAALELAIQSSQTDEYNRLMDRIRN